MSQQSNEDDSVRHLVALGYLDPDEEAQRTALVRLHLAEKLRQATELVQQGRGSDAAPLLVLVIENDPQWIAPRQLLAEVHYRAGEWEEALAAIDWLTLHGVESPRLAMMTGGIALARRELQHALESLEYARYTDPSLRGVHTLIGNVLLRLGNLEEAQGAFQEAIEQNGDDARALAGLATVCLRGGRYAEAADWALQALERNMQQYRAHYDLGVALYFLERPEAAVQALQTAIRVDAACAAPYFWLTRIAEQAQDAESAAAYRQRGREVIRSRR